MRVYVLTLFPAMLSGALAESILGRAQAEGRLLVELVDIRGFAPPPHRTVDDYPYGGGAGMVLKPEPLVAAIEWAREQAGNDAPVILTCAQGRRFDQAMARALAEREAMVIVCGHYEGVDDRVREYVDLEVSLGDFVLTGGEIAALAVVDAVARLLPGVLGHAESAQSDSFSDGLLEGPQYTRPPEFRGRSVPAVLLSGDHERIRRFRRREALRRTRERRPDLLERAVLTYEDRLLLRELEAGQGERQEG